VSENLVVPVPDGGLHVVHGGSGPDVVLAHAGAFDNTMWDELAADLERDHHVIRYDARSQGRSSTASGDHVPADDLVAVLDAMGVERAALVGCSMGAVTVSDVAWRYPDRVTALVMIGGDVSPVQQDDDPFLARWAAEQDAAIRAGSIDRWVEAHLRMSIDGPHRAPEQADPVLRERCRATITATVAAHHSATGRLCWYDIRPRLSEVLAPTLVVVGEFESDAVRRTADLLAASLPEVRRVDVENVGHMVMLEAPERTAELVRAHLVR
jgi:3-oxoadipate enol-lactonase